MLPFVIWTGTLLGKPARIVRVDPAAVKVAYVQLADQFDAVAGTLPPAPVDAVIEVQEGTDLLGVQRWVQPMREHRPINVSDLARIAFEIWIVQAAGIVGKFDVTRQ